MHRRKSASQGSNPRPPVRKTHVLPLSYRPPLTAYEATKHSTYGKYVREGFQVLVPFVLDTYGALGATAIETARRIAPLYGRRLGLSSTVASRIVFGRLTTCVVRWMATIATLA